MMKAKECRAVRLEIDSSEMGQRLSEQAESHLRACPACAEFQVERGQLRELVGSLKPVTAPADFDIRLRARIARERDRSARQPFIFRFAMTTPGIAVAATLVIMVALGVWINQRNRPSQTSSVQPKQEVANAKPSPAKATEGNTVIKDETVAKNTAPRDQKTLNSTGKNVKASVPANLPSQTSDDRSARRAPSVPIRSDRDGEVSLTAPSKPMVVTVQDANGATHKILLPPISFGSQRFDNRTNVSMTNRRDW